MFFRRATERGDPGGYSFWGRSTVVLFPLLFLLVAGSCAIRPEQVAQACTVSMNDPIRIMTYNIRIGRGVQDFGRRPPILALQPERIDPVIAAIKSMDPDIVALQEVLGPRQAQRLAEDLGMHAVTVLHPTVIPWWGVSVLSRCPLELIGDPVISPGPKDGKRAAIARVRLLDGDLAVASVHKDTDLTDGQSFFALAEAAGALDLPLVIAGDLNVTPGDARFKNLGPEWIDTALVTDTDGAAHARGLGTFVGRQRRIDYVLVRRNEARILDVAITGGEFDTASDHRGYMAVVKIGP